MTFLKKAISVSALGISAMVIPAMAANQTAAPTYNPASETEIQGVVTAIRQVPGSDALSGVHLTVKAKNGTTFDVVVGPAAYLKFTKTNILSGDYIAVQGSLVNGNVILSRELDDNGDSLLLRDPIGNPMWQAWGM